MHVGRWSSVYGGMLLIIVPLEGSWEWVSACEVEESLEDFLVGIITGEEVLPWSPVSHNSKKFNFIVSLEDELLDEAGRDLVLNRSDVKGLIDDLHSLSGDLLTEEFVGINVWEVLQLLEGKVV